jgi:hypothetical protein
MVDENLKPILKESLLVTSEIEWIHKTTNNSTDLILTLTHEKYDEEE